MAMPTLPPEVANVRGLKPPPFSSSPDPTHPRLSMSFTLRLPLSTLAAIVTGFSLGLSHGAITSGLRFRAENAHRLPTTSSGWFLYHKSKNYNVMLGGIKEGAKMGMKLGLLVGGFCATEEAVDRVRGGKDAGSTVVAGGTVAGIWSLWSRWTLSAGRRDSQLMAYQINSRT